MLARLLTVVAVRDAVDCSRLVFMSDPTLLVEVVVQNFSRVFKVEVLDL